MTRMASAKKGGAYIGFWAGTVVGVVESLPKVPDTLLNSLLPYLVQGLKSGACLRVWDGWRVCAHR